MATFSALVDRLVFEVSRPDKRTLLIDCLNSSVSDVHAKSTPSGAAPVLFYENLLEVEFTPLAVDPCVWPIPKPALFMGMEAIKDVGRGFFYQARSPRTLRSIDSDMSALGTYYRTGSNIALVGARVGAPVLMAYYNRLAALPYKEPSARVVIESSPGDYTRNGGGAALTQAEIDGETNWMLARYEPALRLGSLAKFYVSLNDLDRAKMTYSAYETAKAAIQAQEPSGT